LKDLEIRKKDFDQATMSCADASSLWRARGVLVQHSGYLIKKTMLHGILLAHGNIFPEKQIKECFGSSVSSF